jgi:deoxycytidylate deaminase
MNLANDGALGYYPDSELVFGVVCPIGIDYQPLLRSLSNYLNQFGYDYHEVKISDYFEEFSEKLGLQVPETPGVNEKEKASWRKIRLGDLIAERTRQKDILALVAAAAIEDSRQPSSDPKDPLPVSKTAHVIVSLKRPKEVETLRRVYGTGFFLMGIAANEKERTRYFDERGFSPEKRAELVEADAAEKHEFGQKTRDTFYLSDVFVSLEDHSRQIERFLDLVFGCPFKTPTFEERSMYLAYAASLSSGDLARQVGAALMDSNGDCLGIGWNDVPKAGGGLYGPGPTSYRDMDLGQDSNDAEKMQMATSIIRALRPEVTAEITANDAREHLAGTGFFDITEFGRAVHAEMEALLACARTGRSPRSSVLFATTFPCHNCTRHIIAAGLSRVYYIEPYAKSKALKLHGDACTESLADEEKIPFLPFIGIGPRRYLDLFSLSLGTGYPLPRKRDDKMVEWSRTKAAPRLQMAPVSYLIRESLASISLKTLLSSQSIQNSGERNDSSKT